MALDFPISPSIGQLYPSPPVAGQPVYKWDGEKWAVTSSSGVIYAPFDAMAYSGLQINGGMEVSQERGTSGTTANNTYVCDGWKLYLGGTMGIGAAQQTQPYFSGLPYYLNLLVSTAQASLGPSDYVVIQQAIEGWRIARLGWGTASAQPITISFWSMHHRTGVYGGSVYNAASNKCYAFNYTQAVSDVPQYNTIVIPGCTAGVWNTDNTVGVIVNFSMGSGSSLVAPTANTWLSASYQTGPGQINGIATTSDGFRITGVIVLPGNQGPTAAQSPNVMRPFDQELVTCRRYYRKTDGQPGLEPTFYGGYGAALSSTVGYCIPFQVPMRAAPTIAVVSGSISCQNSTDTQPRVAAVSPLAYTPYVLAAAAGPVTFQSNTCVLSFDARL
jgi:hypothetical protein